LDVTELRARVERGEPARYLFFWGHRPAADGRVTKSCLSQWWEAPFQVHGETFRTAEHWMMVKKADLFGDRELRARVLAAATPQEAKALGRQVSDFDEATWVGSREGYVVEGNWHKFSQHPALRDWLLSTGDQVLVEASPVDAIWGIGLDERHPDAPQPARWPGLNLLGFALMDVREQLRS
jgi:ribA/ribD-fused uncharacterized protein